MSESARIYVVDDDDAVRRSLSFVLKTSGFDPVVFPSGDEFLREARHADPGCVLLDIRMPGLDGLEVQRELNDRGIAMPVIVLTGHGDVSIAVEAMKAGAIDFLEKPFEKAALLAAIDAAFRRFDREQLASSDAHDARVQIAGLTPRERDVLQGLVRGHPNKTIAYDLGISPRTVEVHRANLMTKLKVRSLSEALRLAFAAGLTGEG